VEQKDAGFELKISLRSLAVVAVGAMVLIGGRTIYSAVETNQMWFWILVQIFVLLFGMLTAMVVAGVRTEKNE
jgi:hypothetical protein